ncbi:MAG TPA: ABC transporter ATP-binding protein [Campylobacterales bacterium]|nr:ABC transporter ATP-binding protein [Campylobacterales bacterium]
MSSNIVVATRNLELSYNPNEPIIKDTNISINKGDFIFLTGKSGSGKSTFLKALYGEIPVTGGELQVNGFNLKNISKNSLNLLRRHTGVIFQDYKLINEWTIEKNVILPLIIAGYSKEVCTLQAKKLLKHVRLLDKANKYPMELSGGEQQRVAMARALAHNPKLIVADEPTGNLDDFSSEVIWNLLKNVRQHVGSTIIVVTHKIPPTISIDFKQYYIDSGTLHEII